MLSIFLIFSFQRISISLQNLHKFCASHSIRLVEQKKMKNSFTNLHSISGGQYGNVRGASKTNVSLFLQRSQ